MAELVAAGRDAVPYFTQDATDGMAVAERGGLRFAVAIPFALPAGLSAAERTALHEALVEEGGSWSIQSDPRGELLVVPLLRDTARTWAVLRSVLATAVRHRGSAKAGVAAVVRIAPGDGAAPTIAWRMAVARLVRDDQAVLRRLGANPRERGVRVGIASAAPGRLGPASRPSRDYVELPVTAAEGSQAPVAGTSTRLPGASRVAGAIFAAAGAAEPDGFVFDCFDASLEPGVVQAHLKLALAVVALGRAEAEHFGDHGVDDDPGDSTRRSLAAASGLPPHPGSLVQRVRIPDGRLTAGSLTVYELDDLSRTGAVTDLLTRLFRRDSDIEQQLTLAALNPWPQARAVLTDEGAARAVRLAPVALSQSFAGGIGFLPAQVPVARYEQYPEMRRVAALFTRPPFRVLLGVGEGAAVTVFDRLEITAAQFATLLRSTAWQPSAGLLLTFVRLDDTGGPSTTTPRATRRRPLPAPSPEDWPHLLDWSRRAARLLDVPVYLNVAANVSFLSVPDEVLDSYEAYGPAEAARLMRDWRTETQTTSVVLRCVSQDTNAGSEHDDPPIGTAVARLPENSDRALPLINTLRDALDGVASAQVTDPVSPGGDDDRGTAPPKHVEPGFVEHPELFDAVADQVVERLVRGEAPVPRLGSGASAESSAFWLELDFVFVFEAEDGDGGGPGVRRDALFDQLRAELGAITPGPWTLAESPAAGGGLVTLTSPQLGDDDASWSALDEALAAVRRHGGAVRPGSTARLRIELAGFGGSVGRYQALIALVRAHQPVLHRIACDPAGLAPAPMWPSGGPVLDEAGIVRVPPWSATVDPAILQTRTRVWLGLVETARKRAAVPSPVTTPSSSAGNPFPAQHFAPAASLSATNPAAAPDPGREGPRQPVRHPRDRPLVTGRIVVYEPGPPAESLAARSLLDTALTGRAERAQAAALVHVTAWPGARGARVQVRWGPGWASFGLPPRVPSPSARRADADLFGADSFTAQLDLSGRRAVPVVHDAAAAMSVRPEDFALLLREVGRRPGAPVVLHIDLGARRDWSELAGWIRALVSAVDAPVYLAVEGTRAAELPDAALEGFALYTRPEYVSPGLDWAVTPPRELWLGHAPERPADDVAGSGPDLIALPDRRLRDFVRDASWQGVGGYVLFVAPEELAHHVRQAEELESDSRLLTAVFARSRGGVPQVVVDASERDLEPAELAAVLLRHAGAAPGAELRLVVLDGLAPDDDAWRDWAARAAAATGRIVHYPAPGTRVLIPEVRRRGRRGARPGDYLLTATPGADPAQPRWRRELPGPGAVRSAFTDDEGRLRPAGAAPEEER